MPGMALIAPRVAGEMAQPPGTTTSHSRPRSSSSTSLSRPLPRPHRSMICFRLGMGPLSLSLRNEEDLDIMANHGKGATVATLFSGERMDLLRRQRAQLIDVIRGHSAGTQ